MKKNLRFSATVDVEIMKRVDKIVKETRVFRNRSHAIEVALAELLPKIEKKEKK